MAQLSKVFFPYDPLPAQDLNDIVGFMNGVADGTNLEDGAVTADKIDLTTFGIASGSRAMDESTIEITGLGFKPSEVEFMFFPGTSTNAAYTSTGWSIRGGIHRGSTTYASTSATRRVSSAAYSILLTSASATIVQGFVSSFNDDGFTITMVSTGGVNDVWAWKARQ